MRTQQEILDRIESRKGQDHFGFEVSDYINTLSYKNAESYLKGDVLEKDWDMMTITEVKELAIEYMDFAWEKANDERSLSAGRTMRHYIAWMWLLGEDFDYIVNYTDYGKDHLVTICKYLNLDHTKWDKRVK